MDYNLLTILDDHTIQAMLFDECGYYIQHLLQTKENIRYNVTSSMIEASSIYADRDACKNLSESQIRDFSCKFRFENSHTCHSAMIHFEFTTNENILFLNIQILTHKGAQLYKTQENNIWPSPLCIEHAIERQMGCLYINTRIIREKVNEYFNQNLSI